MINKKSLNHQLFNFKFENLKYQLDIMGSLKYSEY